MQNTSPLQKVNEESLTYLNQGQAYGMRLKRRDGLSKIDLLKNSFKFSISFDKTQQTRSLQASGNPDGLPDSYLLEVRTMRDFPKTYGDKPDQPGFIARKSSSMSQYSFKTVLKIWKWSQIEKEFYEFARNIKLSES